MEEAGLVRRRRDPANRRVDMLELTKEGEAVFERLAKAAIAFDRHLRRWYLRPRPGCCTSRVCQAPTEPRRAFRYPERATIAEAWTVGTVFADNPKTSLTSTNVLWVVGYLEGGESERAIRVPSTDTLHPPSRGKFAAAPT